MFAIFQLFNTGRAPFYSSGLLLYFCIMKRLLIHCLIAVTLMVGVTALSVPESKLVVSNVHSQTNKQTQHNNQQATFSAIDLFVSVGITTQQTRLTHLFQSVSFRLVPSFSNSFRISYFTQVARQQYATGTIFFLQQLAFKQTDGYYLYHLRKLLI